MHTNTPNHQDERLKIHEAVGVVALVAFVAACVTISFAAIALRGVTISAIDHIKKKGKP